MINTLYTSILRPGFFRLKPEAAHHLTLNMLRLAGTVPLVVPMLQRIFAPKQPGPAVKAFGLTFANPVGLAAGYDKEGDAIPGLASLGFSHLEIGTVTPRPQPGNPSPRVFRIPPEEAVINRMGFPNRGAEPVVACLRRLAGETGVYHGTLLGVNLGKNKVTPLEQAVDDYASLIRSFGPVSGYLAINVSSPNTPDLRKLQSRAALEALLGEVARQRQALLPGLNRPLPILVKLAPDLSWAEIDDALAAIEVTGMDGVIATNTTLSRASLRSPLGSEAGGLSGAPLRALSTEVIRYIVKHTHLPVVGVGGIMAPHDAREKLDAGAVLVQLYTGMIYAGPGLVQTILNDLNQHPG
jgi:dihydroorotate dehydrogenase